MDALLLCLHLAAYLATALALPLPRLRRAAIVALAAAALLGVVAGATGDDPRTLTTVHTYAAYEGAAHEVSMVAFPTGTFSAPGWQWPLPFAGFAALWAFVLWRLRERPVQNPLLLPLAFAWTAVATWLAMQVLAAPAALVQPLGADRFLWPAGLAGALLAARTAQRFVVLFVYVGGGVLLARLPVVLFSKYASDARLGTVLDTSSVIGIVNPMTQMQFEPPLVGGTGPQQFWTIWLEHVIVFPAVYSMSLLGIAFGAWMFHRHGDSAT
jgi:hypothetical protein